jgi:hypothetical protein
MEATAQIIETRCQEEDVEMTEAGKLKKTLNS